MKKKLLHASALMLALACAAGAGDADAAGKRKRAARPVDPAHVAAEAAYKAYEQRQYEAAVERAQEAVRLAPQRGDYQKLLASSRDALQRSRAQAAGAAMYKALQDNDVEAAIRHGQAASELAPEHAGYRLAWVFALLRGGRFAPAEKAASEALALLPDSAAPLALRAYARDRQGRTGEARADLDRALQQRTLSPEDAQHLRLMAANLGRTKEPPSIDCSHVETQQTCSVRIAVALPEPGFEVATAGYAAMEAGDSARALELARQAVAANPARRDWQLLRMHAAMAQGQSAEAQQAADAVRQLGGMPPLDQAYLSVRLGDDRAAHQAFAQADGAGALPESALLDAGYAAMRAKRDTEAVGYMMRAIDAADTLKLKLDTKMVFDTRRAISEISRKWGVLASLTWRPGGGAVPGFGSTGAGSRRVLQAGAEAYWRPWGYRNGEFVELFARGFQTLHSEGGGATGSDSFEGALGARWKPLSGHNAVLSAARVFGSKIDSEWLVQAAYSLDRGTDLRLDVPHWWTQRFWAEAGRYFGRDQTYALASLQVGRSWRMANGRTVLFPHAVLAADYDSAAADRTAVGVGPGVSVRHWFREDKYHAPRSFLDLTLQYRVKLAGDDRARGLFATTLLSY
jgi:adsorption protein A